MNRFIIFFMSCCFLAISCSQKIDNTPPPLEIDRLFELRTEINERLDGCEVGITDGTYPESSFESLASALEDLEYGISQARAGVFILQFEVDNYVTAAERAIRNFDDSIIKIVEPGRPAELYVNGVGSQGWIDFGASPDYAGSPAFTVEVWTKYNEGFIDTSFGSFISTFISPLPYEGWSLHYWGISNSAIRFCIGTDNADPNLTLPTIYTGTPLTYGQWIHFAAVFDASNDFMGLYVNGELKHSAVVTDNIVPNNEDGGARMWAFIEPTDKSRCMAGYIRNFRLWRTAKTAEEIAALMTTDVTGEESDLICAWDFTIKPEDDTAIPDKTGRHTASLNGIYKWTELTE